MQSSFLKELNIFILEDNTIYINRYLVIKRLNYNMSYYVNK